MRLLKRAVVPFINFEDVFTFIVSARFVRLVYDRVFLLNGYARVFSVLRLNDLNKIIRNTPSRDRHAIRTHLEMLASVYTNLRFILKDLLEAFEIRPVC